LETHFPTAAVMIKPYDLSDVKKAVDRMLGMQPVSTSS
jgi:hypothetical protein